MDIIMTEKAEEYIVFRALSFYIALQSTIKKQKIKESP